MTKRTKKPEEFGPIKTTDYDIYKDLPEDIKKQVGSPAQYLKIMTAFNRYLMNYMIFTGKSLFLPKFAGELCFIRRKTPKNTPRVDYNKYNKLDINPPKFTNKHTEGFYGTCKWFTSGSRLRAVPHKNIFKFTLNDSIKDDFKNAIINHNTIYKYPHI